MVGDLFEANIKEDQKQQKIIISWLISQRICQNEGSMYGFICFDGYGVKGAK